MDGTNLRIPAPTHFPNLFVNRKGFHSCQMIGICDHLMKFMFVYTGEVGSMHDTRVMVKSGIPEAIENGNFILLSGVLIIDSYFSHILFT